MFFKLNLQSVDGESYTRCHQIIIDNRLDEPPAITFAQEQIVTAGGRALHIPQPSVGMAFDPQAVIPILDPETGADTGTSITQAEAYALLYSAYVAAATATTPAENEED